MTFICRLCLDTDLKMCSRMDTDDFKHQIQSILPEINIDIVKDPVICESCKELLLNSYSFKCICLQIEDELTAYAHADQKHIDLVDFLNHQNEEMLNEIEPTETKVELHEENEVEVGITEIVRLDENKININKVSGDSNDNENNRNENEADVRKNKQKMAVNKCKLCKRLFLRKSSLDRHTCTKIQNYNCSICGLHISARYRLIEHMRSHTGERPHQCTYCGKAFAQASTLSIHVRSLHKSDRPHVCEICDKSFPVKGAYTSHMRRKHTTVEKKYICTICGKAFVTNGVLDRHMKWHSKHRDYMCHVCSKKFVDNGSLKKHLRIHNGDKPFECHICRKRFTQNYNKKVHVKSCMRRNAKGSDAESSVS